MKLSELVIGVVAVLALVLSGFSLVRPETPPLGGSAGPEHTETQVFHGGSIGAGTFASTTSSSTPLLAQEIAGKDTINLIPATYQPTFTLPPEVNLNSVGFLSKAGMRQDILLCNATTTAAKDGQFTFAAGVGVNLVQATSTLVVYGQQCADLVYQRNPGGGLDLFYNLGY